MILRYGKQAQIVGLLYTTPRKHWGLFKKKKTPTSLHYMLYQKISTLWRFIFTVIIELVYKWTPIWGTFIYQNPNKYTGNLSLGQMKKACQWWQTNRYWAKTMAIQIPDFSNHHDKPQIFTQLSTLKPSPSVLQVWISTHPL